MTAWRQVVARSLVVGVVAACATDPPHAPLFPVAAVSVTGAPADGVYQLGGTHLLAVQALDPSGAPLLDRAIHWQSSAPAVATVSPEGAVTGVAVGGATLRVVAEAVEVTVPIEVREGVRVPSEGVPVVAELLGGLATLTVPVGVAPVGTLIHVRVAPAWEPDDRLVAGTVIELGPSGTELGAPIQAGVAFAPADIPAIERPNLRLFAVTSLGAWALLDGGSVDVDASRVSANVTRLTTIAVFRRATPTQLVKLAGDGQSAKKNSAVAIAPSVEVLDAAGRPVFEILVTFATGPEGGNLTGQTTILSGLDGVATLPGQWRMGGTPGTYTLTASIAGGISVVFTATGTP